ncbi:MAG TPA: tetratricopeptide repeat protein [Sedimentisphaerales bacterium]|nr:tetratricopeptide repeat protein [Sedimentisphaerales bacterium]
MREILAKYRCVLICVLLGCGIPAVYWQVLASDFVNIDDTVYVTENPHIKTGFSAENVKWVFTIGKVAYWHPLTWLSHILDCQLYGLRPGLHHLTNLVLHIANSLLVFWVFKGMTGAVRQSAFVAAAFAFHPVNVDSVAWIAERKNVLSTLFWLLTMRAYTGYAREGGARRYLFTLGFFTLGLLAKPMLITLPFAMLLLDYWPLKRLSLRRPAVPSARRGRSSGQSAGKGGKSRASGGQIFSVSRLVWEKAPFFALSAVSVFLSFLSMRRLGVTTSTDLIPMKLRLANAAVSYVRYIDKIICPRKLAVFYPYPMDVAIWRSLGAVLLLACASFVLIWVFRRKAYLSVGWLWFIGTLFPVIGLVQAGLWPAIADRWAYVPMIGLSIIVAWGAGDLAAKWRLPISATVLAACACLSALGFCTYRQAGYWRSSRTLFGHALDVTTDNYIAHLNFGNTFIKDGKIAEAMSHYGKAVEIHPAFDDAHYNLGVGFSLQEAYQQAIKEYRIALNLNAGHFNARLRLAEALTRTGSLDEATGHFERLLQKEPDNVESLNNYALALVQMKRTAQAMELYDKALRIDPDSVEVLNNLGAALAEQWQFDPAIAHLRKALRLKPGFTKTYYNLADAFKRAGHLDDAVEYCKQALRIDPQDKVGQFNLGRLLSEQKNYDEAAKHYEQAIELDGDFAVARYNLGQILAGRGETDKAITQFREVLRIYPNDAEMNCNLGTLLAKQGRLDEAIEQFRTALRLDPSLSRAGEQLNAALAKKSGVNTP